MYYVYDFIGDRPAIDTWWGELAHAKDRAQGFKNYYIEDSYGNLVHSENDGTIDHPKLNNIKEVNPNVKSNNLYFINADNKLEQKKDVGLDKVYQIYCWYKGEYKAYLSKQSLQFLLDLVKGWPTQRWYITDENNKVVWWYGVTGQEWQDLKLEWAKVCKRYSYNNEAESKTLAALKSWLWKQLVHDIDIEYSEIDDCKSIEDIDDVVSFCIKDGIMNKLNLKSLISTLKDS